MPDLMAFSLKYFLSRFNQLTLCAEANALPTWVPGGEQRKICRQNAGAFFGRHLVYPTVAPIFHQLTSQRWQIGCIEVAPVPNCNKLIRHLSQNSQPEWQLILLITFVDIQMCTMYSFNKILVRIYNWMMITIHLCGFSMYSFNKILVQIYNWMISTIVFRCNFQK